MDKKICTKCKIEKVTSDFSLRKDNGKRRNECTDCKNKYIKNYRRKNKKALNQKQKEKRLLFPWKITFSGIKSRCLNLKNKKYYRYGGRGIECLITEEELKILWFRDKAYLLNRPSIDRKDNDGNYEFENCQYIELVENSKKDKYRPILQYDKQGNFIKEWSSITEAYTLYGSTVVHCLVGNTKSSKGFVWKYKEK